MSSALRVILRPSCPISQLTLARADWARYFRDAAGLVPSLQDFRNEEMSEESEICEQKMLESEFDHFFEK